MQRFLLCLACCLAWGYQSFGSHLRAGEITVRRLNCSSLTFEITITVYTNTRTEAIFGGDQDISYLYFGDSTRVFVPSTPNIVRPDLDPDGNIAVASFTVTHTYSSYRQYKISYQEPNRNGGVLNMFDSFNTLFYIETTINLDPYLDASGVCSSSPRLKIPPIDKACIGATWTHDPGAFDPDLQDRLTYEMVIPNSAKNVNVRQYREPNDAGFYTNYAQGNEDKNGIPTWSIDSQTGLITWDAPGKAGEYNIAFVVKEWRQVDGVWYNLSVVRRDMQIIVEDCDNQRPDLLVPAALCVEAGTVIDEVVRGTDPDGDPVKIEAFSPVFEYPPAQSPAEMRPREVKYQIPPTNVTFHWQTECLHVREQPYQVVFKITDNPPPSKGARLATYKTWSIKVVGPRPKWADAVLNAQTQSVDLTWEPYVCANAGQIIVYRRVGSNAFVPAPCETGLAASAGYSPIDTLDLQDGNNNPITTYHDNGQDKGLSPGAEYCYRLVAVFPQGVESIVSDEICVGPLKVEAPVITNVSVEKTGTADGRILVRWTSPFEADKAAYPRPYSYKVYRGEGFAGPVAAVPITTIGADTTFVDSGLNTEDNVYHYQVVAYAQTGQVIDTSRMASSVRAEAKSQLNSIALSWSADVPWSNQRNDSPREHLIYRGAEGAADGDLVLIASVDVLTQGFTFTDGLTTPLDENQTYCYRIMTRGGYGNPLIPEPLENFSQKICAQPGDATPPCKPESPKPQTTSCDDYVSDSGTCRVNQAYTNVIEWERPGTACADDIAYYNLYVANVTTGEYVLRATQIKGILYEDTNLSSYARCYRLSAVDRSGNESELSEPVCFDNCPYYELPNVFTPGMGDDCNARFSAFSGNDRYIDQNSNPELPQLLCGGVSDVTRCARFVERVVFRVYNRWGGEVYNYTGSSSDERNSIYVDWDGRASDGSDLAAGVYYYIADVTFYRVDPSKKQQTLKGWVHLIR